MNRNFLDLITLINETRPQPMAFKDGGAAVKGPGNGVSDSVPTKIKATKTSPEQPAALSEGEFVIRADVVSNLGGGASDPGVQFFDKFVEMVLAMDRETAALFAQGTLELGMDLMDTAPKIEEA